MTVGAASGLNVILKTLLNPGEQVITFAPYFVEYGSYVRNYDGELVVVSPNTVDFQPNLVEFEEKINEKTKAVIINTPNNPTGVIYSEETLQKIAAILEKKQKEFGTSIVLLSDEPYRELAYDGAVVPYVTKYYANTLVCYSYSKSLSLPGERIGYVIVPDEVTESKTVYAAIAGAGRALGYVCAPSMFQKVIASCVGNTGDIELYRKNRDLLYDGLTKIGYECFKPQGAFYMFVKALEPDADAFCERAKEQDLLIVSATGFGCPGYARVSYCVDYDMIERSFSAFEKLYQSYRKEI
jgi:aspartate aminotransferase